VKDIVVAGLESEKAVTKMINDLVDLAESERDHATKSFLQWFVDEQVEEMSTFSDLLTMVELAKDNLLQVEARLQYQLMTKDA
jgi:ferritin